jgi:hypothetical protein
MPLLAAWRGAPILGWFRFCEFGVMMVALRLKQRLQVIEPQRLTISAQRQLRGLPKESRCLLA